MHARAGAAPVVRSACRTSMTCVASSSANVSAPWRGTGSDRRRVKEGNAAVLRRHGRSRSTASKATDHAMGRGAGNSVFARVPNRVAGRVAGAPHTARSAYDRSRACASATVRGQRAREHWHMHYACRAAPPLQRCSRRGTRPARLPTRPPARPPTHLPVQQQAAVALLKVAGQRILGPPPLVGAGREGSLREREAAEEEQEQAAGQCGGQGGVAARRGRAGHGEETPGGGGGAGHAGEGAPTQGSPFLKPMPIRREGQKLPRANEHPPGAAPPHKMLRRTATSSSAAPYRRNAALYRRKVLNRAKLLYRHL